MAIAFHVTLRAKYPHRPFTSRETCRRTWLNLRRRFDSCVAALLMPNHLHLLVRELGDLKWLVAGPFEWDPVSIEDVPDPAYLRRTIRYIHLNPCRKELCRDPLLWEWTTHRDYLGAVADPWPRESLRSLGFSSREEFHRYVSSDATVHPLGTPTPRAPAIPAFLDLAAVERAALLATRAPDGVFRRQGAWRSTFMRLLADRFEVPTAQVARHLGVDRTTVHTSLQTRDPRVDRWAPAVLQVLNDERLLHPLQFPTQPWGFRGERPRASSKPHGSVGFLEVPAELDHG